MDLLVEILKKEQVAVAPKFRRPERSIFMKGVLSYRNESNEIILIDIEGKDQEELFANGKKKWDEMQKDPDKKKRPAWDSKPTFRF